MLPHEANSPLPSEAADAARDIFVVEVRHNVVVAIRKERASTETPLPATRLETATQLAENFQRHGCLDGIYRFQSVERARVFAILCLEFVEALVTRRVDRLRKLRPGDLFDPD